MPRYKEKYYADCPGCKKHTRHKKSGYGDTGIAYIQCKECGKKQHLYTAENFETVKLK